MNKKTDYTLSLAGLAFALCWYAPTASWADDEDCYSCVDDCCVEAWEGSSGKEICTNDYFCFAGNCSCNDCLKAGASCDGSAAPPCENPKGVCEEHQIFLMVPNGTAVGEPANLFTPRVLNRPGPAATEVCPST